MDILARIEPLLPYILPPVLGAFIGYVTNYLAIRMLFRPLQAWYVFGCRVPLTPGIFPAKRQEIATRMGNTVGRQLITPAEIKRGLSKHSFRKEFLQAVQDRLTRVFDREHGPLASLVPSECQGYLDRFLAGTRKQVLDALFVYASQDDFQRRVRGYLYPQLDHFLSMPPRELFGDNWQANIEQWVTYCMKNPDKFPAVERGLRNWVRDTLDTGLRSERPLNEIIPPSLVNNLYSLIETETPAALDILADKLNSSELRADLTENIQNAVANYLSGTKSLGGTFTRILVQHKVDKEAPKIATAIEEELTHWLRDEQTRTQVIQAVWEHAQSFFEYPVTEVVEQLGEDNVDSAKTALEHNAVALLHHSATVRSIRQLLHEHIQNFEECSLHSILAYVLSKEDMDSAYRQVSDKVIEHLHSDSTRAQCDVVLRDILQHWVYEMPIGKPADRLSPEVRHQLEELATGQLFRTVQAEVPALIENLDVQELVNEKMNALPIRDVEGMLLGAIREHFVFINLFGAFIGFTIGVINIFI